MKPPAANGSTATKNDCTFAPITSASTVPRIAVQAERKLKSSALLLENPA
jgi:hypothetical protein